MQKLTPEFNYMKNMPMGARIRLIIITATIGFGLQLFVSPILGWFFILAAALMGSFKSVSNEPDIRGVGDWQTVTVEEMERVNELLDNTSKIKSVNTASCTTGCLIVGLVLFIGFVLFILVDGGNVLDFISPVFSGGSLSVPFAVDALTFIIAIMISGKAAAWEPPNLRTKLQQVSLILDTRSKNPQIEFVPSLQLAKTTDGMVPTDCKLLAKIKDSGPNFIGIQVQVSFNQVQGQSLPYTYCVLLAKSEFKLMQKTEMIEMPPPGGFSVGFLGLFADENEKREAQFARFHGSIIELKKEKDVDIVVVRQDTSGARTYTTTPDQALEVFSDAYLLACMMLREGKS